MDSYNALIATTEEHLRTHKQEKKGFWYNLLSWTKVKIVPAFLLFTNLSEIRYKKKSPWKHITKWLVKKKTVLVKVKFSKY